MIMSQETLTVALLALALDALIGWPDRLYRRISHPVVWLGKLIAALDRRWNRGGHRVLRGMLAALVTIAAAGVPAILLTRLLMPLPLGPILLGALAWPLIAKNPQLVQRRASDPAFRELFEQKGEKYMAKFGMTPFVKRKLNLRSI